MDQSWKTSHENSRAAVRGIDRPRSPTSDWEFMVDIIIAMNEEAEQQAKRRLTEIFWDEKVDMVRVRTLSRFI